MKRTLIAGLVVSGLLFAAIVWLQVDSRRLAVVAEMVQATDEALIVRTAEAAVDESSKDRTPSGHLVEVEFVFYQDKARRAVTGLVVHSTAEWSLIAVESSAGRAPEGLNAIDRVWMTDRDGRRLPMQYIPFTERTAKTRVEFYRVNAPRPVLPIAELAADLKTGTSLTAVSMKLKPDLEQRERVEAVTFKSVSSRELSKDWRLQRGRGEFKEPVPVLIELNRPNTGPLAAGTPLFLKDECVGIAIDTADIQGPDRNRSFALLAAPIKEVLPEVIEKAESIEPRAPKKALTSPPNLPSVATDALPVNVQLKSNVDTPSRVLSDIEASRPSTGQRNLPTPATTNDSPAATRVANEFDAAMDRDTKQLALRVRAAQEPEKSKLRSQLEKLTEQHFEHRQSRRDAEIAELADRVDKLRVAQHRRQENKADIIKRRVAELVDPDKKLEWDEANAQSTAPVTTARRAGTITNAAGAPKNSTLSLPSATKPEAEPNAPSKPDAKSDAVTAALVRAAEARCELAEAEVRAADRTLSIALKSNQKVPGTIPIIEIEKLELDVERRRAEFKVALAELQAAQSGVDIARTNKPKSASNDEPTYNNVTLSEWLQKLENERNPEKLAEAVLAMNSLANDAEQQQLVRATLRMMQTYVRQQGDATNSKIFFGSVGLLCLAKSDFVVDSLIAELNAAPTKKLSLHFRIVVAELLHSLARQPDGVSFPSNYPVPSVSNEAAQSLRIALRKNSSRWMTAMVAAAQRDPALSDWLIVSSADLLTINEQRLTEYSDLVPHFERVLADANSGLRPTAARFLGSSKLHLPEIIELTKTWLTSSGFVLVTKGGATRNEPAFDVGVEILVTIAPQSPQAVAQLTETLRDRWTRYVEQSGQPVTKSSKPLRNTDCVNLVEALGRVGEPAREALPFLREIEQSPASNTVAVDNDMGVGGFGESGGIGGLSDRQRQTLRELITTAIQRIENGPLKPKFDSRSGANRD